MSKRSKLALVILIALLLLLLGLYLLFSPFLQMRNAGTGEEFSVPNASDLPAAGSGQTGRPTASGQATEGGSATATAPRQPTEAEQLRSLEYRARVAVERVGSGSSQSGFLGYSDLLVDSTEAFKPELKRLQQEMQAAHPLSGAVYGVSTRAVSSQIKDQKFGDDTLKAEVQAVQTYDAGNPRQPTGTAAKRIYVTFAKQADGNYLISGMQWEDMPL